jgi:hypothetical protein
LHCNEAGAWKIGLKFRSAPVLELPRGLHKECFLHSQMGPPISGLALYGVVGRCNDRGQRLEFQGNDLVQAGIGDSNAHSTSHSSGDRRRPPLSP